MPITYIGGFNKTGRGTPIGPEKDIVMREISNCCIVELFDDKPTSSKTTLEILGEYNGKANQIVMLARNSKLKGLKLRPITTTLINLAVKNNCKFVVGDFPDVDEQFVKFLVGQNADITVYHAGNEPRFKL